MDRATAAELLGIEINATVLGISKAYAVHHAELAQRERDAPTEALREKYRATLADLETAGTLLQSSSGADALPPARSGHSLSKTKLYDLPLSGLQEGHSSDDSNLAQSGVSPAGSL